MDKVDIDGFLAQFSPYLIAIRQVPGYKVVDAKISNNWDPGKLVADLEPGLKSIQMVLTGKEEGFKIISIIGLEKAHTYMQLIERLDMIIRINREREEKNKLFQSTVKKLEQLFLESDLDKLNNLIIDVPDARITSDEIEVGNTDNIKLKTSPITEDE